jgi:uncharacterized protein
VKIIDVNLLVHAVNQSAPEHGAVLAWLEGEINTGSSIGMPWVSLLGFIRLSINPKVVTKPLTVEQALNQVSEWLSLPNVSVIAPSSGHLSRLSSCCKSVRASHNLITDAHLAALALEHNATMVSCDTDFAKFPGLRWINPLQPRSDS